MIINHGLLPRRRLIEQKMLFGDVADQQIISKRQELGLDIYTPFHFHPYSAFDVAVKNTYPTDKFVYICIRRALAEFNDFKILVKHPLSQQNYFNAFMCRMRKHSDMSKNFFRIKEFQSSLRM